MAYQFPAEITQQIVRCLLHDAPVYTTVKEILKLRLIDRQWNRALTSTPLKCRVLIRSVNSNPEPLVIKPMTLSPYEYPLVANCHHDTYADAFVKLDIPFQLWLTFTTLQQLKDYLKGLIGASVGFSSVNITDVIVNASKCKPIKPYIDTYEDTFLDEDIDATIGKTFLLDLKHSKYGTPPIHLYRAIDFCAPEYLEMDEAETFYQEFVGLRQLLIPVPDRYFLDFTSLNELSCLVLGFMSGFWDAVTDFQPSLKHVWFREFDYCNQRWSRGDPVPFKFKLKSIQLSAFAQVDLPAVDHFMHLVRMDPVFRENMSELETIVISFQNDHPYPSLVTTTAMTEFFDTFHEISNLRRFVLVEVGDKAKLRRLVQSSDWGKGFRIIIE
ncbi:hypothetical protein BCR33DRAFT_170377 [Rhizoclosmatium globosum]|uniref:Uncharacterized protein n=1 Tax=Rhizoclosmatium globosum TaxID=329046 RepID=A0A1Y2CEU9_9FUNG|nr:hypothetical protein BCR33DRAFT_170377 [Rhizoclosmatium globosum]|eukprot:ORY45569.1 hypothetical protein BCR33DRAFT_170377 [Rhizoclosmatium globosum]